MFCDRCGGQLQGIRCDRCERRLPGGMPPSRLGRHLGTLAVLWIVIGGLFLIPAVGLILFGEGTRFVRHEQEVWPGLLHLLLIVAGGSLMILGAGGACVGLGLMQRSPWARTAAVVLGVVALFHPPLGTALGVYTLWVLLADQEGEEYELLARAE